MKVDALHVEDRLLEYVYGELGADEARGVERHLESCPSCSQQLRQMRGVRTVMGRLENEAPPEQGLQSLLAYAQQSADRQRESGAKRSGRRWQVWVTGIAGASALVLVGIVALRVTRELTPASSIVIRSQSERQVSPPAPVPSGGMRGSGWGEGAATSVQKRAEVSERADVSKEERKTGSETRKRKETAAPSSMRAAELGGMAPYAVAPSAPRPMAEAPGPGLGHEQKTAESAQSGAKAEPREVPARTTHRPSRRAQSAAPPAAMRSSSAPAAAPAPAGAEEAEMHDEAVPQLSHGGAPAAAAGASAPPVDARARLAQSLHRAEASRARGDRGAEARHLREALTWCGWGYEPRARILLSLCQAEEASGLTAQAVATCRQVVSQFPGTPAASEAASVMARHSAPRR